MQTETLKVTGMTCGGCTGSVTRALKSVKGVSNVEVSLAAGEATVKYQEGETSPDQLKAAVIEAGYGVTAANTVPNTQKKGGCCSRAWRTVSHECPPSASCARHAKVRHDEIRKAAGRKLLHDVEQRLCGTGLHCGYWQKLR